MAKISNQPSIKNQLILGCHITGVFDVNRRETLPPDEYPLIEKWATSIKKNNLKGILFHNNFSEASIKQHTSTNLEFVAIIYNEQFTPNVFRYFAYLEYVKKNQESIDSFFVTDVSDVEVINNPFITTLFAENPKSIFCGDEDKNLDDEWMHDHNTHFRDSVPGFEHFETNFKDSILLNCGIIGGKTDIMINFLEALCEFHHVYNNNNRTQYTGDMGGFNFICRTKFNLNLIHGAPVNTMFKKYENENFNCWFRHK